MTNAPIPINNPVNQTLILMADPSSFGIVAPTAGADGRLIFNNKFEEAHYYEYAADPDAYRAKAAQQWQTLKQAFEAAGAQVVVMPAVAGMMDLVFTRDGSVSAVVCDANGMPEKAVTILCNMTNPARVDEPQIHADIIGRMDLGGAAGVPHHFIQAPHALEGGDVVYDPARNIMIAGYHPDVGTDLATASEGRTDKRSLDLLRESFGIGVLGLKVSNGHFHIDTSLRPLSKGHMIVYRGGIEDWSDNASESYRDFRQTQFTDRGMDPDKHLFEISDIEAANFAANAFIVGDTVIMQRCTDDVRAALTADGQIPVQDKLRDAGYNVVELDLSCFLGAGGLAHCLSKDVRVLRVSPQGAAPQAIPA